ncbi:50S Ribosomal protein [Parasponia andersonii]|uniref:50S Ribosomal protein n=1 Tax=Parasponia andersonii TaxID=3476 RepID=A0A2P5DX55_PARAD|nr:50S Ribosomal protein [Parasponia andersonii]
MSVWLVPSSPFTCSSTVVDALSNSSLSNQSLLLPITTRSYLRPPRLSRHIRATTPSSVGASPMEAAAEHSGTTHSQSGTTSLMKLLFVEMGVGYDQHGQDITAAAMRACRDAISSNSIPAFRRGSIPGVTFEQMKLQIKLGVPRSLQQSLDIEKVRSVFPYGKILNVEVVDGGLICSSGVHVEEMGDKNDHCYIVNAAVYVGY